MGAIYTVIYASGLVGVLESDMIRHHIGPDNVNFNFNKLTFIVYI